MRRRSSGQSMVELALVLPFLLFIVLGIIETAYYIYIYTELENSTRRASERASKTPPLSTANPNDPNDQCMRLAEADAMAGTYLSRLQPGDIFFSFPPTYDSNGQQRPGERIVGDQIEVEIDHRTSFLTPLGQRVFGEVLRFEFRSRRTITSTGSPRGLDNQCEPL